MPCWFFDKKDLKNTPSYQDGIDSDTEARYRREGARFIVDTGTKMGLRYDSCATGVVYFHRFYLFYSFKQFHRYVTAAACLFLAGKVEETPKKCKDIIKTTQSMLSEAQFVVFGEDPKEEVMVMERIILQTIRFDLQVEHPYSCLLRYAKLLKGDHAKMQKMVQMAWTFINDSLCTTLCLQYESDLIAIALLYLASRLSKLEVQDWHGRTSDFKGKWFEALVDDASIELLEDICHQVLDLYSATAPKKAEVSPPLTMPTSQPAQGQLSNVSNITTIGHQQTRQQPVQIQSESKPLAQQNSGSGKTVSNANSPSVGRKIEVTVDNKDRGKRQGAIEEKLPGSHQAQQPGQIVGRSEYSSYNPFISSQMYSSSFMSGEGAQSIQSIMMGGNNASAEGHPQQSTYVQQYTQQPAQAAYNYSSFAQGASGTTYTNQPVQPPYNTQYLSQQYLPQYSQPPAQYPQYPPTSQYPSPAFQQQQQQYQSSSSYSSYSAPQQSQTYNQPPTAQSYPRPTKHDRHEPSAPGLPTVRITSRPR